MPRPRRSEQPALKRTICLTDREWAGLRVIAARDGLSPGQVVARMVTGEIEHPPVKAAVGTPCTHPAWRTDVTGRNVCTACGAPKAKAR